MLVCLAVCQNAVAITKTYCPIDLTPQEIVIQVANNNNFKQVNFLLQLANAESGFNPNIKVLDVNDRYSYGLYNFQHATFKSLCVDKYGLEEDIYSATIQTQCVIEIYNDMGYEFVSGYGGWHNSCNKINN